MTEPNRFREPSPLGTTCVFSWCTKPPRFLRTIITSCMLHTIDSRPVGIFTNDLPTKPTPRRENRVLGNRNAEVRVSATTAGYPTRNISGIPTGQYSHGERYPVPVDGQRPPLTA